MGFLDRFVDTEKTSKMEVKSPRDIYYGILKSTSGTSYTRKMDVDIFYTVYGFKGVTEGIGCSTLVANVAQAIADMGLSVCVIDTSILSPVQDILLKTDVEYDVANTYDKNEADKRLDWFDMPYEKKSVLHLSKINQNISVLSFKGKKHTIIDFLSTNDSETLVEMALAELHNKFDIILVDICHEPSAVATACLQQSQKIIQVWNDSPTVLGNLERFITNSVTLACPMDKMSNVVYSKVQRDALGSLDNVLKEYKFKKVGVNYFSEEVALQAVIGNNLFQLPSNDKNVIAYTDCVIDVACLILNLTADREATKQETVNKKNKGIIKTEDILNGKVDGTATKKLRDREAKINQDLGITPVKTLEDADKSLNGEGFVDAYKEEGFITSLDEFTQSLDSEEAPVEQRDEEFLDDPDFKMVDLDAPSDESENIDFEPVSDEKEEAVAEEEFAPSEFEASEDEEFTADDFEPTEDAVEETPISDPAGTEDDFDASDFEEFEGEDTSEPVSEDSTEPMETIDVPEEFFENEEEPVTSEDFEPMTTESYDGEMDEVEYDSSENAVDPADIEQAMSSDEFVEDSDDDFADSDEFFEEDSTDTNNESADDEEFFEEGDITDDSEPISTSVDSTDESTEPISESFDEADEFEEPINNENDTTENSSTSADEEPISITGNVADDIEQPISEDVAAFSEEKRVSDENWVDASDNEPTEDAFEELGSDEFFDMADDFEAAPTEENGQIDEFSLDNDENSPISQQLEQPNDFSEPISADENEADSDDFASDEDFFDDSNVTNNTTSTSDDDDEFLDDDDFFLDDDENLKALDNYVKSQNTEYKN